MASLPETYVSQEEGGECLEDKEENTASKMDPDSEELKCVQIANEGMKLLLSSRMREAEEMYRRSRSALSLNTQLYKHIFNANIYIYIYINNLIMVSDLPNLFSKFCCSFIVVWVSDLDDAAPVFLIS